MPETLSPEVIARRNRISIWILVGLGAILLSALWVLGLTAYEKYLD